MKIRLLSDLHLTHNIYIYEYCGEDVLVLAGDITTNKIADELESLISAIP